MEGPGTVRPGCVMGSPATFVPAHPRPWPKVSRLLLFSFSMKLKYLFDSTGSSFWQVGSSSPVRDHTQVPCIGKAEPQPLGHQGNLGNGNI